MSVTAITRLAPSPTGALHLGNARTFLITWAMARQAGLRLLMRIEDMDTPRVKVGSAEALLDTLAWLGIDWDGPALVQSADLSPYRGAIRSLAAAGLAYPCSLTRSQIEAVASAPQEGAHETPFPAELRSPSAGTPIDFDQVQADTLAATGAVANWRLLVPDQDVRFIDRFAGERVFNPARTIGDFVLWTKRDQPSYQLAVVVDDARQQVTEVIRGDDLLESAARQLVLYRLLGLSPVPSYTHLPLVLGPDGLRLAKRHGESKLEAYRRMGVPPEAIVGLVAHWSIANTGGGYEPMPARVFLERFRLATMPASPVTFTLEDDRWLRSHAR